MDSQQTPNGAAESPSDRGANVVKPNLPLSPNFQARPQFPPPGSPRLPLNNGPLGPRPGGQQPPPQIRRLDSRSSLGSPGPGQFVQHRPYQGPPRPPGNSFPPQRPQQGGPQSPQAIILNPRFPPPSGLRPGLQQRPPNPGIYQGQQFQRNAPRALQQQPSLETNQGGGASQPPRNPEGPPRSLDPAQRQLQRNESLLNISKQELPLSEEDKKRQTYPRIVIEKMADVDNVNKQMDSPMLKKKQEIRENGENDDDDDVVMDNRKSPRSNGDAFDQRGASADSSKLPKRSEDLQALSRPGTATMNGKTGGETTVGKINEKVDEPSKSPEAGKVDEAPKSPSSGNAEERLAYVRAVSGKIEKPEDASSPVKLELPRAKTPGEQSQSDDQSSKSPSTRSPDKSRSSTPADANATGQENELKVPSKSPDKSRSNSAASVELLESGDDSKRQSKSPNKSRSSTPAMDPGLNEESGRSPKSPISRSSTPSNNVVTAATIETSQPDTPTENPSREKSGSSMGKDEVAANLSSPGSDKNKSPKSPATPDSQEKLSVPGSTLSTPKSPQESVKGFDNGQRRSLSPRSPLGFKQQRSPTSPKSPRSPIGSAKSGEGEKRKTNFDEDLIAQRREEDDKKMADAKTLSKPPTPKIQRTIMTPTKLEDTPRKGASAKQEVQNGSATHESAIPTTNGVADSPTKKSRDNDKRSAAVSPVKSPSKSAKSLPRTPDTPTSTSILDKKKLPMNKVQVGAAPSPNLKTVRSKIGSLDNASYKPGGGKVKIENRKLDFSKAQPKIAAKNEKYAPSGGDKKIAQVKLQWNAKPKVGSLDNATYKPGGGDKKIETVKLDFKDKAKPKVGSKDNAKHTPGGGSVKSSATPPKTPQDTANDIQTQKIDIKAESKIGSLDNVKHKPGGGDKKIFNDRDYLRQTGSNVESLSGSGSQSPVPSGAITDGKNGLPTSDENLNQEC